MYQFKIFKKIICVGTFLLNTKLGNVFLGLGNIIIKNPEDGNKKTESISISTSTSTPTPTQTTTTIASTRSRFINFESEMEIKIDNSNTLSKFQFIF